jgi:hypothetical protein
MMGTYEVVKSEIARMQDRKAALQFATATRPRKLDEAESWNTDVPGYPVREHFESVANYYERIKFPPVATPFSLASNDNVKADGSGLRHDAGKTRMELLPFDALEAVARVLTKGAAKYAPRNWERGMSWLKCVGCLMRHLVARMAGQKFDKESGEPHLAHVATNALFLLTYELRGIGEDDLSAPKVAS